MSKKYYWLKLNKDFFSQPKIKKLRKIAGGDTYTCIYLKLMLLTIQNDGILVYEGIESTIEAELALTLDEDESNVSVTLNYLQSQILIIKFDEYNYDMTEVKTLIGLETDSAERVRKFRAKKKMLHRNNDVTNVKQLETKCYTEKESESELKYLEEEDEICLDYIDQYIEYITEGYKGVRRPRAYLTKIINKIKNNDNKTILKYEEFLASLPRTCTQNIIISELINFKLVIQDHTYICAKANELENKDVEVYYIGATGDDTSMILSRHMFLSNLISDSGVA